ncbi:MAG: VIT domain-containing protein [Pyrinomonadaceae bacterium]
MRIRAFLFVSAALLAAFVFCQRTPAQGVIVPIICDVRPCRPVPRPVPLPNVLPVKSIKIDVKIDGQVATTHVEQVFRNDTPHTLEGTYFFPIAESASISSFAIWENGKRLSGEVRSRDEARRIYDEIVRRQRDPGLLEYAGKDLFQASIFPIPPNSDKKLELTYTQVLKVESGTAAYRYPLGTGRNLWTPRPEPLAANPRGQGNAQQFGTVSGRVEVAAREPLRNIYSPSHAIDVKKKGETSAVVTFETSSSDSDFELFYGLSDKDVGMSLLTYREPGKDGYFLLMISPRDTLSDRELENKDIVFVIDTSGSMADEGKMDKARSALLFGIRSLREGDRFNVISFAGEERLMERRPIAADAAGKRRGEEFVNALRPSGGTNINDSLVASLKQFGSDRGGRPKMLVFMTDGLPTVGEANIDKIVANVRAARSAGIRVFPFGFGYDVNTALLDRLGSENDGVSDYVQPKEDLEIKVSNFFSRVSSPVLSDIELDFGRAETDLTYPRKVSNLFRGGQIAIIGRYKNSSDIRDMAITVRGRSAGEVRSFAFGDADFPLQSGENAFLPRLWASRRVGWLIEQIRLNGETKELRDEVTELGTRYGIVTPYTSYLATDGSFRQADRASMDAVLLAPAAKAVRAQSGAGAVQMSIQQNSMQSNMRVAAEAAKKDAGEEILIRNSQQTQFVGNKNFQNQNNVWVDVEYSDKTKLPERKLQFLSAEYLDLVRREPALAQYLSLGEEVVLVWKDTVYRITNRP